MMNEQQIVDNAINVMQDAILGGWRFRVGRINEDILREVTGVSLAWVPNETSVTFSLSVRRGGWAKVKQTLVFPNPEEFNTDDIDWFAREITHLVRKTVDDLLNLMMSEVFPDADDQ